MTSEGAPHEAHPDVRPVVEERRRLLPGRRDLRRRQRRRHRRLPRPHPADRPPGPARRHLHLADALLPVPRPRRRLRHHRLLRCRPAAGHARRLRGVRAHRPRPRHAGDRRPRRQPHLRPAPVVRRGPHQPRLAQARLVHLGRRGARRRGQRRRVPRPGDQHLGARQEDRPVLPAPVLQAPAGPERREPGGPRRDRPDHGLLDAAGPVRLPGGRGELPHRDQRQQDKLVCPTRTTTWPTWPRSCAGATGRRCCSARSTCPTRT